MTAQISAYGRLVADVQSRTTSNGNPMAFTRMAVTLPCQKAENGEATFWLAITAFGKQAEALAKHQKGDKVSVAGNMQVSQWTGNDGGTQAGYQVIADIGTTQGTANPRRTPQFFTTDTKSITGLNASNQPGQELKNSNPIR
ncbi:single-stranded DNA-binding protein [Citrobacter portucalensis]